MWWQAAVSRKHLPGPQLQFWRQRHPSSLEYHGHSGTCGPSGLLLPVPPALGMGQAHSRCSAKGFEVHLPPRKAGYGKSEEEPNQEPHPVPQTVTPALGSGDCGMHFLATLYPVPCMGPLPALLCNEAFWNLLPCWGNDGGCCWCLQVSSESAEPPKSDKPSMRGARLPVWGGRKKTRISVCPR